MPGALIVAFQMHQPPQKATRAPEDEGRWRPGIRVDIAI
jgi:hypothetical protein